MRYQTSQRGFIALISSVVISAILVSVALSASMASFYARLDALGLENKVQARISAESCVQVTLLALATSTDALHYNLNNQTVTIATDSQGKKTTCTIKQITHTSTNATINVYAESGSSFESVSETVSLVSPIHIISWNESP